MNIFTNQYIAKRITVFFSLVVLLFYPVVVAAATIVNTVCAGDFDQGTFSNTQCSSNELTLSAAGITAGTGTYTSKIFDGTAYASWDSLSWTPTQPFYKNLPDSGGADSDYGTGNLSMTNNVVLLHMDESSWSGADSVLDSSGNDRHGDYYNDANTTSTGKIERAALFDGTGDYVLLDDQNDYSIATTGDLSLAFWMQTGDDIATLQRIVQKGSITSNNSNYEWMVQINASKLSVLTLNTNGNSVRREEYSTNLSTSEWYHVVVVFTGAGASDDIVIYVDGTAVATTVNTYSGSSANSTGAVGIGAGYGGGTVNYFSGKVDEFAIFSDQVTAAEAEDMYLRGAHRVKYQLRSCDDNACSGESFVGPDGTANSYYSEMTVKENGLPSKTISNLSENRYVQYQVTLETDSAESPTVQDISVVYSLIDGVPEFSDMVYLIIILFSGFFMVRYVRTQRV